MTLGVAGFIFLLSDFVCEDVYHINFIRLCHRYQTRYVLFRGPQQHRDRTGAPGRSRTRLGPSAGHARLLDAGPGSSFRTVMVMVHNGDCAASAERGLGARPVYKKCPLCKNAVATELRLATRRENGQNHGNFNAIAFCGAVPSRSGHRNAGYHRSCGRLRLDTFYRSSGPPDVSLCVVSGLCRNALRANIAQQARHFSGGLRGYHGGMHGGSGPLLWVRGPQIVLIKRHMPMSSHYALYCSWYGKCNETTAQMVQIITPLAK